MKNTKKTGKHNFKTRIIAGALSLITVFSVGTVAVTSASAAETGNRGYGFLTDLSNPPVGTGYSGDYIAKWLK